MGICDKDNGLARSTLSVEIVWKDCGVKMRFSSSMIRARAVFG